MSEFNNLVSMLNDKNDMYSSQFVDERYDAFKAGQQSQQGEVNKLQTKIDELNERNSEEKRILHNVIEMNQAKIDELKKLRSLDEMEINQLAQANQVWRTKCDELQARIDEALKLVQKDCIEYGVSDFLEKAMDILKGNKDEK